MSVSGQEFRQFIILNWWSTQGRLNPTEEHREALEESGFERAISQIAEGFSEGELVETVFVAGDPIDGVDYHGYWKTGNGSLDGLIQNVSQQAKESGYAFAIYSPEEVNGLDPREIEQRMAELVTKMREEKGSAHVDA